jgi:hypothetical protein
MPDIVFPPATEPMVVRYAMLCGEGPRFRWLPRWLMRWRWFRKEQPLAYFDFNNVQDGERWTLDMDGGTVRLSEPQSPVQP